MRGNEQHSGSTVLTGGIEIKREIIIMDKLYRILPFKWAAGTNIEKLLEILGE